MKFVCEICIVLVPILLPIQVIEARYCPEAVDSALYVKSCPSSKSEWDAAAQKKNCSRLALHQSCSTVENFQYHCVIDGYRTEMVEVCAPSRIIFGHCVEFNLLGGVIQDQFLSQCNNTFPKCDDVYESTTAYKYPDCYNLVSKSDVINSTTTYTTITTQKEVLNSTSAGLPFPVLLLAFILPISNLIIVFFVFLWKRKRQSTLEKEKKSIKINSPYIKKVNGDASNHLLDDGNTISHNDRDAVATTLESRMVQQFDFDQVVDTEEGEINGPTELCDDDKNNIDIVTHQTNLIRPDGKSFNLKLNITRK